MILRRPLLLLSLLVVVPALGMLCLYLDGQREGRVSKANADRIEIGMPRAEVERLLGGPGQVLSLEDSTLPNRFREWRGPGGNLVVVEFLDGRVAAEPFCRVIPDWRMLDRLMEWLGL